MAGSWHVAIVDSSPGVATDLRPALDAVARSSPLLRRALEFSVVDYPQALAGGRFDAVLWDPFDCGATADPVRQFRELRETLPTADIVLLTETDRLERAQRFRTEDCGGWLADIVEKSPDRVQFANEAVAVLAAGQLRVVIWSDLHFGPSQQRSPDIGHPLEYLHGEVDEYLRPLRPEGLLACGDLTTCGDVEEFREARVFLKEVLTILGIGPGGFGIIPGNHDMCRGSSSPLANYAEFVSALFKSLGADENSLGISMPLLDQTKWQDPGTKSFTGRELTSVTRLGQPGLTFVGFSSAAESAAESPTLGWDSGRIDPGTIHLLKTKGVLGTSSHTARAAFAHHHFMPVPDYFQDDQVLPTRNTGFALEALISADFGLLIHGNAHHAAGWAYEKLLGSGEKRSRIVVLSVGNLAAASSQQAQPLHSYFILRGRKAPTAGLCRLCVQSRQFNVSSGTWGDGPFTPCTVEF